jgi:hypothetical protein
MSTVILIENNIQESIQLMDNSFWSIDSAGSQVRLSILKKSAGIKLYFYVVCVVTIISFVYMSPLCGSQKEWNVGEIVIEELPGLQFFTMYTLGQYLSSPLPYFVPVVCFST